MHSAAHLRVFHRADSGRVDADGRAARCNALEHGLYVLHGQLSSSKTMGTVVHTTSGSPFSV